ncbi:SIR2 family protein [Crenobacter cavernae]|uniref:SIR2 family protein n=2 Tax=Crenobacter cavernae TaxID=2290923 RepID=A0A345Y2I0_9NEIS|nr:SIR2 family protein [Crenobacter cavernae]
MDLHTLKSSLQAHLSDGLVTIVGSGLSCAEGLPGMGELADYLLAHVGHGLSGADADAWSAALPLIFTHGLEAALLAAPPTPLLEALISAATGQLISERERKVVSEVFAGKRKLRLTRLLAHMVKPAVGMTIVTTNYDRLVEIAVEEADIGADTMFTGRFAGQLNELESRMSFCRGVAINPRRTATLQFRPRALICKPHGSLDWYARDGRPVFYAGDLPDAIRLIITPGRNKFRNGYESPFDHHRSRANDAIDRASRYLILGYGFNDDHLETHLSPGIKSGKPTLMLTRSLSTVARQLALMQANVIALEYANLDGVEGTSAIVEQKEFFFPGVGMWDVDSFVTEVLEP